MYPCLDAHSVLLVVGHHTPACSWATHIQPFRLELSSLRLELWRPETHEAAEAMRAPRHPRLHA